VVKETNMKKWNEIVSEAKKMNQKDYKFYLLNKTGTKIRSGWEYKEDAQDAKEDDPDSGKIMTKSTCMKMNIDPDKNENWGK
jgi:L-rhamnose mutarotase